MRAEWMNIAIGLSLLLCVGCTAPTWRTSRYERANGPSSSGIVYHLPKALLELDIPIETRRWQPAIYQEPARGFDSLRQLARIAFAHLPLINDKREPESSAKIDEVTCTVITTADLDYSFLLEYESGFLTKADWKLSMTPEGVITGTEMVSEELISKSLSGVATTIGNVGAKAISLYGEMAGDPLAQLVRIQMRIDSIDLGSKGNNESILRSNELSMVREYLNLQNKELELASEATEPLTSEAIAMIRKSVERRMRSIEAYFRGYVETTKRHEIMTIDPKPINGSRMVIVDTVINVASHEIPVKIELALPAVMFSAANDTDQPAERAMAYRQPVRTEISIVVDSKRRVLCSALMPQFGTVNYVPRSLFKLDGTVKVDYHGALGSISTLESMESSQGEEALLSAASSTVNTLVQAKMTRDSIQYAKREEQRDPVKTLEKRLALAELQAKIEATLEDDPEMQHLERRLKMLELLKKIKELEGK